MANTHKGSVLTQYIIDLIENNEAEIYVHGIDKVFYGDQRIISDGIVICVEPTTKGRDYANTSTLIRTLFETTIIVYVAKDTGVQTVQQLADTITENLENFLNKEASPAAQGLGGDQFNGLITDGIVTSTEHGYRLPSSQIIRANRLLFSARSRTTLLGD